MTTLKNYNETKEMRITFNNSNGYVVRFVQFINNGLEKEEQLLKMKTGFETHTKAVKWAKKYINHYRTKSLIKLLVIF